MDFAISYVSFIHSARASVNKAFDASGDGVVNKGFNNRKRVEYWRCDQVDFVDVVGSIEWVFERAGVKPIKFNCFEGGRSRSRAGCYDDRMVILLQELCEPSSCFSSSSCNQCGHTKTSLR